MVGELSLLGNGPRTATVLVARQAEGWRLDRRAFDVVRADLRPGSVALIRRLGILAAERVRDRYETIAAHIGVTPAPQARSRAPCRRHARRPASSSTWAAR